MSQTLSEIQRVFSERRQEIYKVAGDFSQATQINQLGEQQLYDSTKSILERETGKSMTGSTHQHNPVDYLNQVHQGRICPEVREEAILIVLQFAIQTECLDQTVLQAVHLADTYLRRNSIVQPAFVRIISAIALEISIKLNEQMILSLDDVAQLFENRFSIQMLQQLERHILLMNQFRLNVATPLDFCLHFTYSEREFFESHSMRPEQLANMTLPLLHYAMSQYNISRKRYSSIAIAAVCHIIQENSQQADDLQFNLTTKAKKCRDEWLSILVTKYEEIDLEEVSEILKEFNSLGSMQNGQNGNFESLGSKQSWDFTCVRKLADLKTDCIAEIYQIIDYELNPHKKMSLPEIGKLSLEYHMPQQNFQRRFGGRRILNENDDQNNVFMTSDSEQNIFEHSKEYNVNFTPIKPQQYEEQKNENEQYPTNILGRPSFSDNTADSKQRSKFHSPLEKRNSKSKFDYHAEQDRTVVSNFHKAEDQTFFEESTGPTEEHSRQSLHTAQMMKSIDSQRHNDYFTTSTTDNSERSGNLNQAHPQAFQKIQGTNQTQKPIDKVDSEESSEDDVTYASKGKKQTRQKSPQSVDKIANRKTIRKNKSPQSKAAKSPQGKPGGGGGGGGAGVSSFGVANAVKRLGSREKEKRLNQRLNVQEMFKGYDFWPN